MDTRYWGPSGWRLLHMITFGGRGPLRPFFETLPYVLPCRFCRQSLSEYIQRDSIPSNPADFPRWLWRIHNDVNAKLRKQGNPLALAIADPPFQPVRRFYEQRLAAGCSRTHFEGWEFLFSVAESHPYSRQARSSVPNEGHPPLEELEGAAPLERNRWNVMTPAERLPFYERFWTLLPQVLPFQEWTAAWRRAEKGVGPATCRASCLRKAWAIRQTMEKDLELLNKTTYASLCKELRTFRSGCGRDSGSRGKTCRRKRDTQ